MKQYISDNSIYVTCLAIEGNVWKPSHTNHKNLPVSKFTRTFSGICVFDLSVAFDIVNVSWLLLLVIFP